MRYEQWTIYIVIDSSLVEQGGSAFNPFTRDIIEFDDDWLFKDETTEGKPSPTDSKEDEIWGLMLHNRYSTTFAVYESEKAAEKTLLDYVKEFWEETGKEEPKEFKPIHIDQYFAESDTEGYQLEKMVMNGAKCLEH